MHMGKSIDTSCLDDEKRTTLAFSQLDLRHVSYLFLVFFVLYSYEITNFGISIDDEVLAFKPASIFTELGRWIFPAIRETLWPQVVTPLGPYILFGICVSLAYVYILRATGIQRIEFFHYALFAAFILFPVWPTQLEFNANVIPLGLGILSVSASILLAAERMDRTRARIVRHIVAPSLLIAIAAGAYQSAVLIFPVGVIGIMIFRALTRTSATPADLLRQVSLTAGIFLLGCMLYLAIAAFTMALYEVQASSYGKSQFNPTPLLSEPGRTFLFMLSNLKLVYFDLWKPYGIASQIILSALAASTAVSIYAARGSWRRIAGVGAGILLMMTLPAAFCLISGTELAVRTLLGAPFAVLLSMLFFHHALDSGIVRKAAVIAVLLIGIEGLYIQSVHQARATTSQRQDMMFASAINTDVLRALSSSAGDPIPIDFGGVRRTTSVYPALPTSTAGYSFFEWDGGNPYRMVKYLHILGYLRYVAVDQETRARITPQYANMPTWPAPGSIKVVEGIVLVKLSDI